MTRHLPPQLLWLQPQIPGPLHTRLPRSSFLSDPVVRTPVDRLTVLAAVVAAQQWTWWQKRTMPRPRWDLQPIIASLEPTIATTPSAKQLCFLGQPITQPADLGCLQQQRQQTTPPAHYHIALVGYNQHRPMPPALAQHNYFPPEAYIASLQPYGSPIVANGP